MRTLPSRQSTWAQLAGSRLGLVIIVKNDDNAHADGNDEEDDCDDDGNGDGGNGLASLRKCTQRAIPRDTRPSIVKQKH